MKTHIQQNSEFFEDSKTCLNCNQHLSGKFCSNCGQKSEIYRITFKNFILHDILHGVFHFESGMFFTAKEAIFRPGKSALDYIYGKRKRYYNIFLLILITIGFTLFVHHFYNELLVSNEKIPEQSTEYLNNASKTLDELVSNYNKYIILLFVPLTAINTFVLFRRKKLNLSEHFIVAGMILLGILLFSLLGKLIFYLNLIVDFSDTFIPGVITTSIILLVFLHIIHGIYDAFGADYTKLGITYRILLYFIFLFLEMFILFVIVVGVITNWKFGEITFSPFS
jgi:hypothetical protein